MSKYVDVEKLRAEIERRMNILDLDSPFGIGGRVELELVLDTIASLHQEMELPEKYQTPDWIWEDKTIDQLAEEYVEGVKKCNDTPTWELIHTGVCYGYELGKSARKEEE